MKSEFEALRAEVSHALSIRASKRNENKRAVFVASKPTQDELRKSIGDALSAGAITGQQASQLDLMARHGALPKGVRDALASAAKSARA